MQRVVREHLETFLAEARARGGGAGLPRFVEKELRAYLGCGVMACGFARFRCDGWTREILVAFSCKGRGFCPSCCGRRMGERAAHLVDGVLGGLLVRQWVLTLPFRLRYRLAYDHRLCRAVLGVFVRALLGFTQRRARALGMRGRAGAVTAIQRCGSALNVNPHFHTVIAEGVFAEQPDGSQRFVPLREPPSDVGVARLLARVRGRILRLLRRNDIDLEGPGGLRPARQRRGARRGERTARTPLPLHLASARRAGCAGADAGQRLDHARRRTRSETDAGRLRAAALWPSSKRS